MEQTDGMLKNRVFSEKQQETIDLPPLIMPGGIPRIGGAPIGGPPRPIMPGCMPEKYIWH